MLVAIIRAPLPKYDGAVTLAGRDEITVRRDAQGVPHIYASSDHDLFFGQGYCAGSGVASSRWTWAAT